MPVRQFSAPQPGTGKPAAFLRANSPEDRVVAGLQLLDADVAAHLGAEPRLDAKRQDAPNFRVELIAGRAVAGDAVAHHAAELLVGLEECNRVAVAAEEISRREASGTAADHSDFLARTGARRRSGKLMLDGPIADILLDAVDADEVVDLVAVAAILARRGADAAHHRRERIGFHHALERIFLPRHAGNWRLGHATRNGEPAANIVPGWAAPLAGRRAVNIGWALVGAVRLEDLFRQAGPIPHAVAVLEAAEGMFLGVTRSVSHARPP